jgi:hypothetical protein
MEPITAAATTAAVLFATKLLEEAGSQAGKALSAAAGRLVAWVRGRGKEDAETGAAVTMVEADPGDEVRVQLLGRVLAARAERDPQFGLELAELVGQAREAGDTITTVGGAHIHGNVSHSTVNQAGRDQYQVRDPRQ